MHRLPPLNALRAFEAAARHLSFKEAAQELNVTPGAVSQQVKSLEDWLGTKLFHRLTRALTLTPAGQAALPELTEGFDRLVSAVERMARHSDGTELSVSVSPSFGALWLVPRLDRFRALHPEIEIRIDGTDKRVDIARGEADVAIRYGPGGYRDVRVDTLFPQFNAPVCSPALIEGTAPLRTPQDLSHHTLLHIDWKDAEASWRMWLLAANAASVDSTKGPRFSEESMAVQAAIDGHGVALVGDKLVSDHIAAGRLIYPFGAEHRTPLTFAYHVLTRHSDDMSSNVACFREWLLAEADPKLQKADL